MKTRVNLTLSDNNLEILENLSLLTKKSKSAIIDELLTESEPVFRSLSEILRKAQHLQELAKFTIKAETLQTEKNAQKLVNQANKMMRDLDDKISAEIVRLNRKKPPVSNTGVRK